MEQRSAEGNEKVSGSAIRLTRERWVEAAIDLLTTHGVEGVRVEKLAKDLKVTKGSFYWHFKDRDELLEAMLEYWRRKNTLDILEYVGRAEDPAAKLDTLLQMPFKLAQSEPLALPMRLWARHDPRAEKVLAEIDELRVRMKAQILIARGFSPEEARARAVLLYSYMRVAPTMPELNDLELRRACERLLVP